MITLRKAEARGHANHGWLDTYHTFSFADYYEPEHMGFRALRVINDDRVAPGKGFPTHPHRDMEIVTYVLQGSLEHRDSMGNGSVIRPGDVQRMTAGTGVKHSEFNASDAEWVHLLQIWMLPEQAGLTPGYEQKAFSKEDKAGKLKLVASRTGEQGSVMIHQDARMYGGHFDAGQTTSYAIEPGRHVWVQVAQGVARLNDLELKAGDGVALTDEKELLIAGVDATEIILFDLA